MFRRFLLLLLCLAAVPAVAESRTWVHPIAPTTDTAITFYFRASCESLLDIRRAGSVIHIIVDNNPCSPPRTEPLVIPLPEKTLPPGEYRVEVSLHVPTLPLIIDTFTFVVRDADPNPPFVVHPSAVSTNGGFPLEIWQAAAAPLCHAPAGCRVFIGGVEATATPGPNGVISVIAPPHAPGAVDVVVRRPDDQTFTARAALYYYDLLTAPPRSVFERVLFPLLFNTPGANGSQWRTESSIDNPNSYAVETANVIFPIPCPPMPGIPCGERIEPLSYQKFEGGVHPRGVALLVPRVEAPYLSFGLRVRDVANDADNFGSEIPVVRERDMIAVRETTLLDIPRDSRYRVKVRVYAFDESERTTMSGKIRIVDPATKQEQTVGLEMTRNCSGVECAFRPYYAEYDFPAATAASRVNLYVSTLFGDARTLTWAFASVTNNKTQQVTIISPGGAPDPATSGQ